MNEKEQTDCIANELFNNTRLYIRFSLLSQPIGNLYIRSVEVRAVVRGKHCPQSIVSTL